MKKTVACNIMGDWIVNINKASLETLESLKGVGRAKAKAIILTREKSVDKIFSCIEDLLLVPGIGQNLIDLNREVLFCDTPHTTPRRTLRPKRSYNCFNIPLKTRLTTKMNGAKNEPLNDKSPPLHIKSMDDLHHNGHRARFEGADSDDDEHYNDEMQNIDRVHSDSEDSHSVDTKKSTLVKFTGCSGSSVTSETSSMDYTTRQQKQRLSSRLRNKSFVSALGSDTPQEEVVSDILDVPLSPMRISDGDEIENDDYMGASMDTSSSEEVAISLDENTNSIPDKKQTKRKSEGGLELKGLCPVKKSCKAVDSSDLPKLSVNSLKVASPPGLNKWLEKYQSWSTNQKLLALDSLINICDLTQVRHIHQTILPQFQRDFIALLPKELALHLLSYLEPKDLLQAAQTCKYWNALTSDNLLWKRKCLEAGLDLPLLKEESYFECNQKDNCSNKEIFRKKKCNTPDESFSHMSPFKAAFMRQHRIEMNWRVQPLKPPSILKGHDDHVITCLQFSDDIIVSGSDDNTLKVWNATTGKCVRTLCGHTGGVWSSQMGNKFIVSGSTDRMLRVWNADTGTCVHTLFGHTSTVRCLHLHERKVVSGSRDATLRVWDIITGMCEHVLVGHVAAVRCVQYNGKLVVSGAYDYLVKIWDPIKETCIHTLQGHTNRVYSLQFDGVHVVSGSLDTSIRVWDVETGECRHTLMGHQSLTSGMELKNNILISGNADSTVKVWDILTGQCLQTLSGSNKHRSAVTCLQFNKKFVVTSSDDGTVKLWDVKTGEFIRNLVVLQSGGSGGVVWRIRASETKLVCAVGSRNGTEETKLLVLDFDVTKRPIPTTPSK